jgi:TetR/AcrR family transcriptional regulator, transcriptional repressor for nem operon
MRNSSARLYCCAGQETEKIRTDFMSETLRKGEQTRQTIIELAAPIFNRRGFTACSLAEIMEATGLEKGGIYRHFAGKDELAEEVFRYSARRAFEARGIGGPEEGDALTRLRLMIARFIDVPSPIPGGCPLLNTAIDCDDGNPALRKLAARAFAAWKRRIRRVIEQGIEEGVIQPATNAESLATVLIATLEGALAITRVERKREALKHAQTFLEGLLDQIAVKQKSRRRKRF